MAEPALATPRVLIIEDEPDIRADMIRCLTNIPEYQKKQYGIRDFDTEEAESVAAAERVIKGMKVPWDLVLLDLRLPKKRPGDGTEEVVHGHKLLTFIMEHLAAKGVVIVSQFKEYDDVISTIRGGALDYVRKGFAFQETLQPQVLNALKRLMIAESERLLNQRVRDLVTYAEVGLAYSFWGVFKRFSDDVKEAAGGIEKYVRERYGLERDKDANDSLMLRLSAHRKAVSEANREWAKLQADMSQGGKSVKGVHLGRMMRDIREGLLPSLVVKRVAFEPPDFGDTVVLTFEKDVEVVLREIVAGAVGELPDYGEGGEINVSFQIEDTRVAVRFEDTLEPIYEEEMKAINDWQRILPDAEFGRAWGLSVAQHVALRGGGSLSVDCKRGRNVITYHIPLADHE
jgi:response regulator of citrate/malate metabolism